MHRYSHGRNFLLMTGLLTGCGGDFYETASVSGRVTTCEGQPAFGAEIVFSPLDAPEKTGRPAGSPGQGSQGQVAEDGTFKLTMKGAPQSDGALIGPHQVLFKFPRTKPPTLTREDREMLTPQEQQEAEQEFATWPVYPAIPCGGQIQPAEVEVVSGDNSFEFTLPPLAEEPTHGPANRRRFPRGQ